MERLSYQLDKSLSIPLYLQLYQQIRQAIHELELKAGDKLPSKRHLCEFLQISQNTVESAYGQLLAEGYIESQARRGFFVCFQSELAFPSPKLIKKTPHFMPAEQRIFDLSPNGIDTQHFPLSRWQKSARHSLRQHSEQLKLGDRQGEFSLRFQIAQYLSASRGVNCDLEQIIIGAGLENCMQQLILMFNHCYPQKKFTYAMESYGYATIEKLLRLHDKNMVKLPLDSFNGQLDVNFLVKSATNIAYLTPSHLYPFGHVLSIGQRQQLLEWASQQEDRYLIEDDYDSEFRYKGKPIPALQSLDTQDKVIYLGSFSKLLMPALRIGFMVLPKSLLAQYQQYCGFFNCAVSRFEQQRLAEFIQQGDFEKHIHRMRKIYRRKMELLCNLFAPHKEKIRYYGEHSGLYLLLELVNEPRSLQSISQQALAQGIKIYPVEYESKKLFPIGFANLTEEELLQVAEKLLQIFLYSSE